jgi:hypothetical protein
VIDNLSIHVLRYFTGEAHSHADDFLSMKTWQVAEDGVWTASSLAFVPMSINVWVG